jgi:hypothetical protein
MDLGAWKIPSTIEVEKTNPTVSQNFPQNFAASVERSDWKIAE